MVTLDVDFFDRDTEIAITRSRSGLSGLDSERIVDLVRAYRASVASGAGPTVRSCIMIAKVLSLRQATALAGDAVFEQTCLDVLGANGRRGGAAGKTPPQRDHLMSLIKQRCRAETAPGVINLPRRA